MKRKTESTGVWLNDMNSETGSAEIRDASTGGCLANAMNAEIAEQIAREHNLVSSLAKALDEAVRQCAMHNDEYHHRTSETALERWRELLAEAKFPVSED
jgi:hypothetical protein